MIVSKIEINSELYNQKIFLPKRRNILDVIKFQSRPHIVLEHHLEDDLRFSTGDIDKNIEEYKDDKFENVVILQIPEHRYIRQKHKYVGYWKTAAKIMYIYLQNRRR